MTTKCTNEIEISPIHCHFIWKILLENVMGGRGYEWETNFTINSQNIQGQGSSVDIFTLEYAPSVCFSTKQLKWFHSFFKILHIRLKDSTLCLLARFLEQVCHLLTECGAPRVSVRPPWSASAPPRPCLELLSGPSPCSGSHSGSPNIHTQ